MPGIVNTKNSYCLVFCEKSFLRWCIAGNLFLLQKISLRPRESGLAARASPSAVAVDFPEASLSAIPCGLCRTHDCE